MIRDFQVPAGSYLAATVSLIEILPAAKAGGFSRDLGDPGPQLELIGMVCV